MPPSQATVQRSAFTSIADASALPPDPMPLRSPTVDQRRPSRVADGLLETDLRHEADVPTGRIPLTPGVGAASARSDDAHPLVAPAVREVPHVIETRLVVDSEAFARVFATAIASVVQERVHDRPVIASSPPAHVMTVGGLQTYAMAPHMMQSPAVPVKAAGGFWASARHLDVLLLGFTTVIVLVVLAAWLA